MGKAPNKVAMPMAKAKGPVKPDYMPQEAWEASNDEQKAYAADPANEAAIREAYDTEEPAPPATTVEGVALAVNESYLPTSYAKATDELALKITDDDRKAFVEAVETEMVAKKRTVALTTVITRAFGTGAAALPRYMTTSKTSNNPDIFEYKKKTSKGMFQKTASEGSVLEITAYKAMISIPMHDEIAKIEKDIAGLGKKAVPPFAWSTRLDELRERRNKLVKKFIFAVRLVHQLADIGDMAKVGWKWIADDGTTDVKDDMSNITPANTCVLLFAKSADGSMGMSLALSPSQILDYRVSLAATQSFGNNTIGSLDNLLASVEPPTPEQTAGETEIKIETFAQGTAVARALYTWLHKFTGPSASKTDAAAFAAYLKSEAGENLLALFFAIVPELEETVTSKDDMRSQETNNRTKIERLQGGTANRQVKDQPDGAQVAA